MPEKMEKKRWPRRKKLLAVLALAAAPFVLYLMYLAGLVAHDELLGISYTK